jgi:hypothetical protein
MRRRCPAPRERTATIPLVAAGSPLRRVARWLGVVVVVASVVVALAIAALVATRPTATDTSGWELLSPMPSRRGEVAAAVTADRRLIVVGGLTGVGRTTDEVALYSHTEGRWQAGPSLPERRPHVAAETLGSDVYVSGGAAGTLRWDPTVTVWRLGPQRSAWEEAPAMPEGRWGHRLVALSGRLYVVGGHGDSAAVLVFDPVDGWSVGAELPRPRDHLGAVAFDGEIWAIGGRDRHITDQVDIYDRAEDRWRPGPPLPAATSAAAVGVADGTIVVVGGEDPAVVGGGIVHRHWRLADDRDRWEPLLPPPLVTHGSADGVLDGRLVIAGGASRQGALSPTSWTATTQVLDRPR